MRTWIFNIQFLMIQVDQRYFLQVWNEWKEETNQLFDLQFQCWMYLFIYLFYIAVWENERFILNYFLPIQKIYIDFRVLQWKVRKNSYFIWLPPFFVYSIETIDQGQGSVNQNLWQYDISNNVQMFLFQLKICILIYWFVWNIQNFNDVHDMYSHLKKKCNFWEATLLHYFSIFVPRLLCDMHTILIGSLTSMTLELNWYKYVFINSVVQICQFQMRFGDLQLIIFFFCKKSTYKSNGFRKSTTEPSKLIWSHCSLRQIFAWFSC